MKRQPINKDNYEEYFLLYVDNELTQAEQEEVEAYVAEHPDLTMELQMFLDTKLDLEDVEMNDKQQLYRSEETGLINQDNVEEFQVLLLDNELDETGVAALASYHANHDEAVKNFDWLKKVKLPEETIVFPDKNTLYRTEKKPAELISIKWYRMAAAAAVLVTAGLLWINSQNEETKISGGPAIAQVKDKKDTGKTVNARANSEADGGAESIALNTNPAPGQLSATEDKNAGSGSDQVATNDKTTEPANTLIIKKNITNPVAQAKANVKSEDRTNNLVRVQKENPSRLNSNTQFQSTEQYAAVDKANANNKPVEIIDKVADGYATTQSDLARTAVAANVKTNYASEALNGDREDEVQSDLTAEDGKQRKGLRGIVRKANRFYNKVTNPDIDKPMVKVANFEIGLPR